MQRDMVVEVKCNEKLVLMQQPIYAGINEEEIHEGIKQLALVLRAML